MNPHLKKFITFKWLVRALVAAGSYWIITTTIPAAIDWYGGKFPMDVVKTCEVVEKNIFLTNKYTSPTLLCKTDGSLNFYVVKNSIRGVAVVFSIQLLTVFLISVVFIGIFYLLKWLFSGELSVDERDY